MCSINLVRLITHFAEEIASANVTVCPEFNHVSEFKDAEFAHFWWDAHGQFVVVDSHVGQLILGVPTVGNLSFEVVIIEVELLETSISNLSKVGREQTGELVVVEVEMAANEKSALCEQEGDELHFTRSILPVTYRRRTMFTSQSIGRGPERRLCPKSR